MNQMGMTGMNPGNPAMRGGMSAMNNGANGVPMARPQEHEENNYPARLNYYIYGYFLERGMWDCARALKDSQTAEFFPPLIVDGGDMNGIDEKVDTKEGITKKPGDLPGISASKEDQQGGFLLSWFELFWDVFNAQRRSSTASQMAANFVNLSQV